MASEPKISPEPKKGETWMFFNVTRYIIGHIDEVTTHQVVLSDAAWIPETGRFQQALESGNFTEVELYPKGCRVFVNLMASNDYCGPLPYDPPSQQK